MLLFFITFFFSILMIILINQPLGLTYILIFILTSITLSPFIIKILKKEFDFFETSSIFSLGYLFVYSFSMIFTILFLDHYFQLSKNIIGLVNKMLFYAIIGIVFYNLGYFINLDKVVKRIPTIYDEWDYKRTVRISLVFFLIGIISFVIILNKVGVIYLLSHLYMRAVILSKYSYMTSLIQLIIPSLVIFYFAFLRYKKNLTLPTIFMFIVMFILSFLGGRFRVFSVLIMVLSLYNYLKEKVRAKHVILLIVFGIFILIFAFYMRNPNYNITNLTNSLINISIENFNYPYFFLKILENVPQKIPYQYGKTFLSIFFYPFPRSIFPLKPLSAGPLITEYLFPNLKYSSVPSTILGEFYLNFSYLGIIIGMFLFGLFHKLIYSYFIKSKYNTTNIYIYSIIVPFLFWCNFLDFTLTIVYLLILIIPAIIIALYVNWMKNEKNKDSFS